MIVIGRKYGQLGNRLLLFSHWIGFATEYQRLLCNPAFEDYAPHFTGTRRNLLSAYPSPHGRVNPRWGQRSAYFALLAARKARFVGAVVPVVDCPDGEHYYLYDVAAIHSITRHRVVVVTGFGFRCEPLVEKHADAIRGYFTPIEPLAGNVAKVVARARSRADVLVGIHMRRGDFRTFGGGRWFYDDRTYGRVMRDAIELFPGQHVGFLVVSNEPVNFASFPGMPLHVGTGHLVEDMYSLAGCDFVIGPPSTYTSWASFYGQVPLLVMNSAEERIVHDGFRVHRHPVP
jgi:hypothetical protein